MVELYDDEEQRWRWRASFGPGWHVIRDHDAWFVFHRHLEEKAAGMTLKRRETLTVRTFGRSQVPIRSLMARAEQVYEKTETVRVYLWHQGGYVLADRKPRRPIETIYLPEGQKVRIVEDLLRWQASRDTYRRRGTPWRRGYLLEGPPGTGKTSLAFAMASLLDRPLYLINLSTAGGDTGLQAAFNCAEPGAMIAIEDIDSSKVTHRRDEPTTQPDPAADKPGEAVTLAGVLNAIDGLASRENRVLIVTSNRADVLDDALLRPGRIDRREYIGPLDEPEARAMCESFLQGSAEDLFEREVRQILPVPAAKLQGLLLARLDAGSV